MKAGASLAAALVISLAAPALTGAAVRHASPSGSGTACSEAAPCSLQTAVESASDGDEVRVAPGSYSESDPVVGDIQSFADIDGEPRWVGIGPDIGADEWIPPPPGPDTNPPDTKILKGPARRTERRRAKFKFGTTEPSGATLLCSVDKRPYVPCESPKRVRVGRGRHVFRVYSIDAAGNVDPTPAERAWRVKRERKGGGRGHGGGGGHKARPPR